jgi:hypothetical protein
MWQEKPPWEGNIQILILNCFTLLQEKAAVAEVHVKIAHLSRMLSLPVADQNVTFGSDLELEVIDSMECLVICLD